MKTFLKSSYYPRQRYEAPHRRRDINKIWLVDIFWVDIFGSTFYLGRPLGIESTRRRSGRPFRSTKNTTFYWRFSYVYVGRSILKILETEPLWFQVHAFIKHFTWYGKVVIFKYGFWPNKSSIYMLLGQYSFMIFF